jgi:hypothetical protein
MRRRIAVAALCLIALAARSAGQEPSEEERRRLEALRAIPYLQWTQERTDPAERGVTVYDREAASPGYTLYAGRGHATLIDMEGREMHVWRNDALREWEHAEMMPGGDLYVILQHRGIYRLDWGGKIVWSAELPVHHDFDVSPSGTVVVVAYDRTVVPGISPEPIVSDRLVSIDPGGRATDIMRLSEHLEELARWCPEASLTSVSADVPPDDWSHMNTVEIVRGTPSVGRLPAFRAGNLLFCARNLDFVGVFAPESGRIVWGWGPGELDHPHEPTLLPNGHILVFDNGFFRGSSRIVEYDPVAEKIVWRYEGASGREFFSRGRGACQALPNGDVLITESAKGRVFEVTRDGRIVWEFFNPSREREHRGTFYRAIRYPPDVVEPLLREARAPAAGREQAGR